MYNLNDKKSLQPTVRELGSAEPLKKLAGLASLAGLIPLGSGGLAGALTLGMASNDAEGSVINALGKVLNKKGMSVFKDLSTKSTKEAVERRSKAMTQFPFLSDYLKAQDVVSKSKDSLKIREAKDVMSRIERTANEDGMNYTDDFVRNALVKSKQNNEMLNEIRDDLDVDYRKLEPTSDDASNYSIRKRKIDNYFNSMSDSDYANLMENGLLEDLSKYKVLDSKLKDKTIRDWFRNVGNGRKVDEANNSFDKTIGESIYKESVQGKPSFQQTIFNEKFTNRSPYKEELFRQLVPANTKQKSLSLFKPDPIHLNTKGVVRSSAKPNKIVIDNRKDREVDYGIMNAGKSEKERKLAEWYQMLDDMYKTGE